MPAGSTPPMTVKMARAPRIGASATWERPGPTTAIRTLSTMPMSQASMPPSRSRCWVTSLIAAHPAVPTIQSTWSAPRTPVRGPRRSWRNPSAPGPRPCRAAWSAGSSAPAEPARHPAAFPCARGAIEPGVGAPRHRPAPTPIRRGETTPSPASTDVAIGPRPTPKSPLQRPCQRCDARLLFTPLVSGDP